jgi:hypothetical protein
VSFGDLGHDQRVGNEFVLFSGWKWRMDKVMGLHDSGISLVGNGKREKRWWHLGEQGEMLNRCWPAKGFHACSREGSRATYGRPGETSQPGEAGQPGETKLVR